MISLPRAERSVEEAAGRRAFEKRLCGWRVSQFTGFGGAHIIEALGINEIGPIIGGNFQQAFDNLQKKHRANENSIDKEKQKNS